MNEQLDNGALVWTILMENAAVEHTYTFTWELLYSFLIDLECSVLHKRSEAFLFSSNKKVFKQIAKGIKTAIEKNM